MYIIFRAIYFQLGWVWLMNVVIAIPCIRISQTGIYFPQLFHLVLFFIYTLLRRRLQWTTVATTAASRATLCTMVTTTAKIASTPGLSCRTTAQSGRTTRASFRNQPTCLGPFQAATAQGREQSTHSTPPTPAATLKTASAASPLATIGTLPKTALPPATGVATLKPSGRPRTSQTQPSASSQPMKRSSAGPGLN